MVKLHPTRPNIMYSCHILNPLWTNFTDIFFHRKYLQEKNCTLNWWIKVNILITLLKTFMEKESRRIVQVCHFSVFTTYLFELKSHLLAMVMHMYTEHIVNRYQLKFGHSYSGIWENKKIHSYMYIHRLVPRKREN